MKNKAFDFEFVHFIPDKLKDNVIYISTTYATVVHKCACGCGMEVVTPLSPVEWKLIYDGDTISLSPSIGNWSFPCQSHYWLKNNQIIWSSKLSQEQIEFGRKQDRLLREEYDQKVLSNQNLDSQSSISKNRLWQKIVNWFSNILKK